MKQASSALISAAAFATALALALAGPAMAAQSGSGMESPQPMGGSPQAQSGHQGADTSQDSFAHWAQDKRVKDITGKDLYDESGKKLGKIDEVVRNKDTNQAEAVIDVGGGLWGMGGKDVALPLTQIEMQHGKLTAAGVTSAEQVKGQRAYEKSQYTRVARDAKLSEFSAFEPKGGEGPSSKDQSTQPGMGGKSPQGETGQSR
jgi:sporulation protein YlmC with PRC-barrel domain